LWSKFPDELRQGANVSRAQHQAIANQFVAEMLGESGGGYDDPGGAPLTERLPEGREDGALH
jgi:hypothetical protein